MARLVTTREKLAFIALDGLPYNEQKEVAGNAVTIARAVPDLDEMDGLLLLHLIGRYMNENPGVKK